MSRLNRQISRRDFLRLISLTAGGSILAACAPQATPAPTVQPVSAPTQSAPTQPPPTAAAAPTAMPPTAQGPQILRVASGADLTNMDPAYFFDMGDYYMFGSVMSGLVRFAPESYEIVNDLADSIQTSEDGKTITFALKKGVKWQRDFGEVTAADVKFSYERIADPANKSPYQGDWASLDHVEVVDDYTGKIVMKEPFAPLWTSTLPGSSGLVVCKKYFNEAGKDKFAIDPLGCGPYIFSEWKPQDRVILKRNPDYYGKAGFDEIDFIYVPDENARQVALDAKELDFSSVVQEGFKRYADNPDWKTAALNGLDFTWIGMNVENPKLSDINVRHAIRYALDVPSILVANGDDPAAQAFCMLAPGLLGSWTDAPHYQRDVTKAKDYMAKAGLKSLDLTITVPVAAGGGSPIGEVAQQNLKDIGINATIKVLDMTAYQTVTQGEQGKQLELFWEYYSMQPDPTWATMWFTCEQIGQWNAMRWCSKEYDDLNTQGLGEMDKTKRAQIYIKMQQLFDVECHAVWLSYNRAYYAYSPTLKPVMTPNGNPQLWYFEPA